MKCLAVLCALLAAGCGSSPTAPTPAPIPTAVLQITGQGSWTLCTSFNDCLFTASIQNTGAGCATNTTIVARFFDANNVQLGSDVQMGASGSLSGRTIRPGEIVPIVSLIPVQANVTTKVQSYRLFPTWSDVRCA